MTTEPTQQLGTSPTPVGAIQVQLLPNRCQELIGDRDYPGAAAAGQQAINLVPNMSDPYVAMAEAMTSMSAHEHAVDAYDEAYQRAQPDKQYEILKGRACNKHCTGNYIGTIEDLTEMIALQPENPYCYIRRGITRAEIADYQGTIDDFNKPAEIRVLDADLHNQPAHAHMHATFAQLNDDNVDVDNTGTAHELAQKALRHFQTALDLNPRHAQAYQGIQLLRNHLPCLGLV